MALHTRYYKQALAVEQVEPARASESWHDVKELLPTITWTQKNGESKTVLIWCAKRERVFGATLHFENDTVFWFARSIEGDLTEIQHHISHVTHWRPIPPPPEEYQ